ncbi:hypothetical protein FE257_010976 [Aspergillus nanangensis]|uniref:Arrestin-like N-terminal domain-containing protein n=1 Tax=Aspergillus nanangensis TaxID=2582783 RepID=A0AAD4CIK0_ASPNN|nr:hypothetical protein FE257_010976 [Aspergillus nanangensis]
MAASVVSRSSSSFDTFAYRSRPKVTIELAGQKDGLVNSYTTGDCIEGSVTVTAEHDTRFDEIEITFEGTSKTSVERATMPGRTGAYQTFLRLRQPLEPSAYPTPCVLEAGRAYEFPFTFVVPERLLPHACSHKKTNIHVERAHTLLPPSLGDPMLASNGKTLLDDLSPTMSCIAYLIHASVLRKPASATPAKSLASAGKKVRVIPMVDEEPPLNITDNEDGYCIRKEKNVKRGAMRSKLGRLVVKASQPKPVQLSPPDSATSDSVSSAATIHLRFDPVSDDEQPPRLGTVWSRLRVSTFYSAEPWGDFPSLVCPIVWAHMGRGSYTETVPLSTMCVALAQWTKHSPATSTTGSLGRCDSLQSTSSDESLAGPTACFAGGVYYTASVVVPITLPKSKAFVPTFHSCLVSRIYALDLTVSYHTPNANILTPSASLRVPIQLTCRPRAATLPKPTEVEITQQEVDAEFFTPRTVTSSTTVPESELFLVGRRQPQFQQPPEYSVIPAPNVPVLQTNMSPRV